MESILESPKMLPEEWEELDEKINEMASQLDVLLNIIGTAPQYIHKDSGS